jgi:uncharacterized glyoxalase superfamily protein PhnB
MSTDASSGMSLDPIEIPQRNVRRSPESFRARSMQASLTVKDIEKSLAWYTEILGFHVLERHERDGKLRAISLVAGEVKVLIGQDDGEKGWDRVKGEGFSLYLETMQDIDALAARIKARGGTLDTDPVMMPWGAKVFRVSDPDGFKYAIASPRGEPRKA